MLHCPLSCFRSDFAIKSVYLRPLTLYLVVLFLDVGLVVLDNLVTLPQLVILRLHLISQRGHLGLQLLFFFLRVFERCKLPLAELDFLLAISQLFLHPL